MRWEKSLFPVTFHCWYNNSLKNWNFNSMIFLTRSHFFLLPFLVQRTHLKIAHVEDWIIHLNKNQFFICVFVNIHLLIMKFVWVPNLNGMFLMNIIQVTYAIRSWVIWKWKNCPVAPKLFIYFIFNMACFVEQIRQSVRFCTEKSRWYFIFQFTETILVSDRHLTRAQRVLFTVSIVYEKRENSSRLRCSRVNGWNRCHSWWFCWCHRGFTCHDITLCNIRFRTNEVINNNT